MAYPMYDTVCDCVDYGPKGLAIQDDFSSPAPLEYSDTSSLANEVEEIKKKARTSRELLNSKNSKWI